jgi:hypothetical protein
MIDYNEVANALEFPRQLGTTRALCQAALAADATVITHCNEESKRLRKEYGVIAISIEQCASLRGIQRATLIDNHAVYSLIQDMDAVITKLKREATLKNQIIKSIRNLLP